jgi:hypothetical protein
MKFKGVLIGSVVRVDSRPQEIRVDLSFAVLADDETDLRALTMTDGRVVVEITPEK